MKFAIKNMVCNRCIMVVESIFSTAGYPPEHTGLGEVTLEKAPDKTTLEQIDRELLAVGFERIDEKKVQIIEKIKNTVIERIHHAEALDLKFNWSVILSEELGYDYNYLSGLFSSVEGVTLEQYIIRQKIERVKELLFYDELNLSEIAYRLGYSSVQHLSGQFRKITGSTPSEYKKTRNQASQRKALDNIHL